MKKSFKKLICVILAACTLIGALTGCDTLDTHIETVQTWEDVGELVKEGVKETADLAEYKFAGWLQNTVHPYEELKERDWEPVLTSYIDNEKLVVSRSHKRDFGVHSTTYLIEFYENDICIGYSVHPYTPCPDGFLICKNGMATLEDAVDGKEEGALVELYPYMRDVFGYLTINKIQNENITYDELKQLLFDGVFSEVIENQYNDIQSNAMGSATDVLVNFVGDATDAVLQTDTFINDIYDLKGSVDDAVEVYTNTSDYKEAAEYYDPVTPMYENGFKTATTVISAPLFNALLTLNDDSIAWKDIDGQVFTKDGKKVKVIVSLSKVKWSYAGDYKLHVWEEHDGICTENGEVQFKVEEGKAKWKHWLSDTEIALSVAQRAMHEKAREVLYPVE